MAAWSSVPTVTIVACGAMSAGSAGCQAFSRQVPGGMPASCAGPAAVRAKCGVSTTTIHAAIWSWMLQPSTATPGLSNTTGVAGTPAYSLSSKVLAGENE